MSNIKKLMMTAAGGEALNVEDVFSTYLYEGNGGAQSIENGIALGDFGVGTSTEFDGVNDFLSRSSDLTGNADGKTFTLSCWVYRTGAVPLRAIYPFRMQGYFYLEVGTNGAINVGGANTSGSTILEATLPSNTVPLKVWTHILVSVDLSNTSNRHIYLNDVAASPTWVTYLNQNIDFTRTTSHINSNTVGSFGSARHAHIYLDYTYRDLSNSTNRRLFIDANGGSTSPSTLSALSPIVYMPMTSAYSIGENLGTGGDYTVNGSPTIIQSGTEYEAGYGEGGLVWIKSRDDVDSNFLFDTERSANEYLISNNTQASTTLSGINMSFNSNGISMNNSYGGLNASSENYASWTFRKAPKFFDVVTYTGNSFGLQLISHNLGVTPGMIIIKKTSSTQNWAVWHKDLGVNHLALNTTGAAADDWYAAITLVSDTSFRVGVTPDGLNDNGATYVAYLFAHNDGDGDFGPDGDADIIKCGTYTGGNGTEVTVNLGFEPQFVLAKNVDQSSFWVIADNMRGISSFSSGNNTKELRPNATNAESFNEGIRLNPNGFTAFSNQGQWNSNADYIYIAIRRGPMAVPESASDVFAIDTANSTGNAPPHYEAGFPVDFAIQRLNKHLTRDWDAVTRLTQGKALVTNSTAAEVGAGAYAFDYQTGWSDNTGTDTNDLAWMWRRAPNFFDVVAYTGTGANNTTISHNLGVAPEMMWIKRRDGTNPWMIYHHHIDVDGDGIDDADKINFSTAAAAGTNRFENTPPTSSVFTVSGATDVNALNIPYIAYLFASLDGVSKVGSYTGDGTTDGSNVVDCGFTNGARFILVKMADGTSNWGVFDTERGIVSGNDPRLFLDTTTAELTTIDFLVPNSSGFAFINGFNSNGFTYIFYAIA